MVVAEERAEPGPGRSEESASRAPASRSTSRGYVAAMVGLLVLAALVRVGPLTAALPYIGYVDEGYVVRPAAHMIAENTIDPGTFNYPSLLMNATAATATAASVAGVDRVDAGAETTDRSPYYDVIEPEQLVLIGRLLVLLFSVGIVLVSMLLARRLVGRRTALLAGLLLAVMPALVSRSTIVIVDTPATFFVMTTLLLASAASSPRRAKTAILLAGASAGLAFTSKYSAGAVILAVLVMVATDPARSRRSMVRRGAAACGAAGVAALVSMPALVLNPLGVLRGIKGTAGTYLDKSTPMSYWGAFVDRHEVGWLVVLLGLAGLVILLRSPPSRRLTLAWAAFAVPFAASFLIYDFQPFRNYLPLVPFVTIAAATAVVEAVRVGARHLSLGRPARVVAASVLTGAIALTLFLGGVKPYLDDRSDVIDNRTLAVEWLEAHARPGDRVLVAEELAFLPHELDRVPADVLVAPVAGDDPPPDPASFTYVVTGDFEPPPDGNPVAVGELAVQFAGRSTPVDPLAWRNNNELVEIHRGR